MPQMRRPAEWARRSVCAQVRACASATETSESIARQISRLLLPRGTSAVPDDGGAFFLPNMPQRRFPPPWSVEETGACFIVRAAPTGRRSPMSILRYGASKFKFGALLIG
jgi:hypothetical protein